MNHPFRYYAIHYWVNVPVPRFGVMNVDRTLCLCHDCGHISVIYHIRVPGGTINVTHIMVRHMPTFAALRGSSSVTVATMVFRHPTLVKVINTIGRISYFAVFCDAVFIVTRGVRVLAYYRVLRLVMIIGFMYRL